MIRILVASVVAFALALVGSRSLIAFQRSRGIGHPIRDDGPKSHAVKAGTPTLGGLAIIGGTVAGYVLSDLVSEFVSGFESTITRSGLLILGTIVGAGLVGFVDDWIKVTNRRNLGLTARLKTVGLLVVAGAFAILALTYTEVSTTFSFARHTSPGIEIGGVGWFIWAVLMIYATSNAVNLLDGADGMAAGSSVLNYGAYTFIAFWIFRQTSVSSDLYAVPHALDIAVVAACMMSACAGFLWFAAAPADIFMGDTGSLAIGTGLAATALLTNTHLLFAILGGIYVVEAGSVVIQVGYFKATKGKRVFRMAPIHHHFELSGWQETKLIVRIWMMSGACIALGLILFYADWVAAVDS